MFGNENGILFVARECEFFTDDVPFPGGRSELREVMESDSLAFHQDGVVHSEVSLRCHSRHADLLGGGCFLSVR